MAGKAENITDYVESNADWDTIYKNVPSCEVGEFSADGCNPVVADLNAKSFSETTRTGDGAPK